MRPSLVLWDWNGTLLDDVDLCVDALNRLLARFGYSEHYNKEQYREIFGFPIQDYYLRAGFDFSRTPFSELAESYMEDYVPSSAACPLALGAEKALDLFEQAGVRQVILSASRLDTLEQQVSQRGIRSRFDRLLGLGDIYARSKVEIGLAYLKEEGFAPNSAVLIGDSLHDAEVAAAMGVRCVLQCAGHQPPAMLAQAGVPVVENVLDAAQMILGLED
ncbi:MAG: HAD family hydrolase [Gemmiger sp.]